MPREDMLRGDRVGQEGQEDEVLVRPTPFDFRPVQRELSEAELRERYLREMNALLEEIPSYCIENGSFGMLLEYSPKFLKLHEKYSRPGKVRDDHMDDVTYGQGLA